MRKTLAALLPLLTCAAVLHAQQAPHALNPHGSAAAWSVLDSLAAAVGLTPAQRSAVAPHHTAIDSILRDAKAARGRLMSAAGEVTPEEAQDLRERFETMQAALDEHLGAIRADLTPAQRTRFDALPAPRVLPRQRG